MKKIQEPSMERHKRLWFLISSSCVLKAIFEGFVLLWRADIEQPRAYVPTDNHP